MPRLGVCGRDRLGHWHAVLSPVGPDVAGDEGLCLLGQPSLPAAGHADHLDPRGLALPLPVAVGGFKVGCYMDTLAFLVRVRVALVLRSH